jgi:hypothetical protein
VQSVGCDWLATATKWWTTTPSNVKTAEAWLTTHPVGGLTPSGSFRDSSGISGLVETSAKAPDNSVQFQFSPGPDIVVRVDAIVVPTGATCPSTGVAEHLETPSPTVP